MSWIKAAYTVGTMLVGGGLLAFLQFLISRHDQRNDKSKEILEAIEAVHKEVEDVRKELEAVKNSADEREAINSRTHILRFDDELCNGMKHSKEYFHQQLHDIDVYETYCKEHEDFKNSYAVEAIDHIRSVYRKCRDDDSFI